MNRKSKIRWGALAAAVTQVVNVVASPLVMGVVGAKTAAAIGIGAAVWQAATKPPVRKDYERTPYMGPR